MLEVDASEEYLEVYYSLLELLDNIGVISIDKARELIKCDDFDYIVNGFNKLYLFIN